MKLKHLIFTLLIALLAITSATFAQEQHKYFTTSDGVRLHYRVSGSGTPLVMFPWCYFSMFGQYQVLKYILGDEAPCLISNPVWTDDENESYTGSRQRRELFTAFQFPGQKGSNDLKQNMMRRLLLDHLANDWRDIIPTIHVPTMIIMGGKSHFASQRLWDRLHTNIPGSRLEVMQDAGHGFYDSHTEAFNKLTIDFLID